MKQKFRYRKKKKGDGLVDEWPAAAPGPSALAERVFYRGSSEHKARPVHDSYDVAPALRSDASRCAPEIGRDDAERALRLAVRARCVSAQFEGDFPRYAWARLDGQIYIARLINRGAGEYKGWPIEESELPAESEQRLAEAAFLGEEHV